MRKKKPKLIPHPSRVTSGLCIRVSKEMKHLLTRIAYARDKTLIRPRGVSGIVCDALDEWFKQNADLVGSVSKVGPDRPGGPT